MILGKYNLPNYYVTKLQRTFQRFSFAPTGGVHKQLLRIKAMITAYMVEINKKKIKLYFIKLRKLRKDIQRPKSFKKKQFMLNPTLFKVSIRVYKKLFTIIILQFFIQTIGNAQFPHITGKLNLNIQKGTLEGDFELSNLPTINNYYISLNSGLNIRYFRNEKDNFNYYYNKEYGDSTPAGCFGYYFRNNTGKGKFLPHTFQISYTGAFPVISDTLKASDSGDWAGNIACNGKTIRATDQSAWYPILYDIEKDIKYTKIIYDIEVTCDDCEDIYLNGNTPIKGKYAHLKSDSAFALLLFAGNYNIDTSNNTYFLNTDMTKKQLTEFGKMTNSYKKYYEKELSIPYIYNITYLQTTPTSKYNGFLFVTYPSITAVGWDNGFKGCFGENGNSFKPFIAHELGHYYFGNYAKYNSELGHTIDESFSEFLSLKVTEYFLRDSIYNSKIDNDIRILNDFNPISIGYVISGSDIKNNQIYNYSYFPIVLVAIEKEIGKEKMWKWLNLILTTKTEFTNYEFLKNTLRIALKDNELLEKIEKKYFKSKESLKNAISTIRQK